MAKLHRHQSIFSFLIEIRRTDVQVSCWASLNWIVLYSLAISRFHTRTSYQQQVLPSRHLVKNFLHINSKSKPFASVRHQSPSCLLAYAEGFLLIMTTILAAQLAQIAAKSDNPLDLKAQKKAHSQSLIFEQHVAATQDFNTLYQICLEGYLELCQIDKRFRGFARSIFSEQSKEEERSQMNAGQNKALDEVVESFLGLVGQRLALRPAIKAVEWLVRRFRWVTCRLS